MVRMLIGLLLLTAEARADARPDPLGDLANLKTEYTAFRAEHGDVLDVQWRAVLVEAEAVRRGTERPTGANLSTMIDDLRLEIEQAKAAKVLAELRRSQARHRADLTSGEQASSRSPVVGAAGEPSAAPPTPDRRRLWVGLGVAGAFLVASAAIVGVWLAAGLPRSPLDNEEARFTVGALGVEFR